MTTWHWVRHGPTHEKTFVGWRDVPADLSDTGQIARLSAHLPDNAILVSSDLVRASATADSISLPTRTRLPHETGLREFNFGLWDGMGFDAVAKRDPDLSRAYWEFPGDVAPPEGESWNMAANRINSVVDKLTANYPDATFIAVAHIGVILTQVQRAAQDTPKDAISHKIDNLSVTTLHHNNGQWHAEAINQLP